jgi:alpha-N-arabinofuranosidase
MKACMTALAIILTATSLHAAEYHVSPTGLDWNSGSSQSPFRTISAAAQIAQPADVITVHEGVYGKRVNPPRSMLTRSDNRLAS